MLSAAPLVAFVPTTDLDRSRRFYCDVLGLQVVESTPYALVLRGGATQLRVTKVAQLTAQPFTVLGWQVPDAAAVLAGLRAAGVAAARFDALDQDGQGLWTTPGGDRVGWFADPEGNLLSVTQPAQPAQRP